MAKVKQLVESATTNSEDRFLDFKEAAAQLGVDASTITRWSLKDRFGRRRLKTVRFPSGRRKVRQSVVNQILLGTGSDDDATEDVQYEKED